LMEAAVSWFQTATQPLSFFSTANFTG